MSARRRNAGTRPVGGEDVVELRRAHEVGEVGVVDLVERETQR